MLHKWTPAHTSLISALAGDEHLPPAVQAAVKAVVESKTIETAMLGTLADALSTASPALRAAAAELDYRNVEPRKRFKGGRVLPNHAQICKQTVSPAKKSGRTRDSAAIVQHLLGVLRDREAGATQTAAPARGPRAPDPAAVDA
jgi:hypothetical protein